MINNLLIKLVLSRWFSVSLVLFSDSEEFPSSISSFFLPLQCLLIEGFFSSRLKRAEASASFNWSLAQLCLNLSLESWAHVCCGWRWDRLWLRATNLYTALRRLKDMKKRLGHSSNRTGYRACVALKTWERQRVGKKRWWRPYMAIWDVIAHL